MRFKAKTTSQATSRFIGIYRQWSLCNTRRNTSTIFCKRCKKPKTFSSPSNSTHYPWDHQALSPPHPTPAPELASKLLFAYKYAIATSNSTVPPWASHYRAGIHSNPTFPTIDMGVHFVHTSIRATIRLLPRHWVSTRYRVLPATWNGSHGTWPIAPAGANTRSWRSQTH